MIHIGNTIDPADYYNLKSKLEVHSKTKIATVLHYSTSIHCRICKFQQIVFLISAIQNKSINSRTFWMNYNMFRATSYFSHCRTKSSVFILNYYFPSSQSTVQISNEIKFFLPKKYHLISRCQLLTFSISW